jgi:phosphatidylserine/phosphatidylglycerophosphate/cardiolipin synthase-like enzyme
LRVGLITPYQKQAALLQGLIEAVGLEGGMRAGTVHRFQGLECDVVVFDTVESPDLPPTLFVRGGAGSDAQRLINVAMTRAREKLIVVANRAYLARHLAEDSSEPGGHTLWRAIGEAARSAVVSSSDVVGFDVPGEFAHLADLLRPLTGAAFDEAFARDLARARERVVLVSPYVTDSRTKKVIALLRPALERGVGVGVLSQPPSASREARVSASAIEHLRAHGVVCESRLALHQKVVVIDDAVAYVGSLNPLSFGGGTHEVMVRIPSAQFVSLLLRQLAPHWAAGAMEEALDG